jgi:hypothetical protein
MDLNDSILQKWLSFPAQKITTLLCKFCLNISKFKLEFYPSFTVGVHPPPPPRCYVPADLRSGIIYIWTRYRKINCTGIAGPQLQFLPGTYTVAFLQLFLVRSNKCKYNSTRLFPSTTSFNCT